VRRCPLWPETAEALRQVIKRRRPANRTATRRVLLKRDGCVFKSGNISDEFRPLMQKLGFYRKGLGFYVLRHVFETVGDEVLDKHAVDHIMGHIDSSIRAHYRERIADERLQRVTQHVHDWLFGKAVQG